MKIFKGGLLVVFMLLILSKSVFAFSDSEMFQRIFGILTFEFIRTEFWAAGLLRIAFFLLVLTILLIASGPLIKARGTDKNQKKYIKITVTIFAAIACLASPIEIIILQTAFLGLLLGLLIPTIFAAFPFYFAFSLYKEGSRFLKGVVFLFSFLFMDFYSTQVNSEIFSQMAGRPVVTGMVYEWIIGIFVVVLFSMTLWYLIFSWIYSLIIDRAGGGDDPEDPEDPDEPDEPLPEGLEELVRELENLVQRYETLIPVYKELSEELKRKIDELLAVDVGYFEPSDIDFDWENYYSLLLNIRTTENRIEAIISRLSDLELGNFEERTTTVSEKYMRLLAERIEIKNEVDEYITRIG